VVGGGDRRQLGGACSAFLGPSWRNKSDYDMQIQSAMVTSENRERNR